MNKEKALYKIKKLLRLATSANSHEAAAAMRQAQVLMAQYAVSSDELDEDGLEAITESIQQTRTKNAYTVALMNAVGEVFGCEAIRRTSWKIDGVKTLIVFVGPRSRAEIALYAYDVLFRQLERDRRAHLKRVKSKKNRLQRSLAFGLSWVQAVRKVLDAFAGTDGAQALANARAAYKPRIEAYIERHYPNLVTKDFPAQKKLATNDLHAGYRAGMGPALPPATEVN